VKTSSTDSDRTTHKAVGAAGRSGGHSAAARDLQWLLANLVEEVPGVRSVAVISSDGLLLCSSEVSDAETKAVTTGTAKPARPSGAEPAEGVRRPGGAPGDLATVVSGLASLTDGAARLMDAGAVKQSVIAMDNGCLFVMSISDGSLLGVHAAPECDMSVVAYHMALFVGRAGHVLTPELRNELAGPPTPAEPTTRTESGR
jgi:predicted regulator of Ras-like GTPase activity (Roadblock/LC7/MglB family)